MSQNVTVLGAGSWGTALAMVLADNGHRVKLWARRNEQVDEINHKHTNNKYLPSVTLPKNLEATTSFEEAIEHGDALLISVPTSAMRETVASLVNINKSFPYVIHASKGIEPDSLLRVSEVMLDAGIDQVTNGIVCLSGPSHAEEVAKRQPTTVTVSSETYDDAKAAQDLFNNQHFRVYTNEDMVGVEFGGSLKNVIALAVGLAEGLGFGDNAKSAIMTRGLAEITRLGTHLGAKPLTFSGLSGLGDLIATCTSKHSRNWRAGYQLGRGKALETVLHEMGMVVEGVKTTRAMQQLADREGIEVPITSALYDVVFNHQQPESASEQLMGRLKKNEQEDFYPNVTD
ncbi:NAD(P)H-dependent glycerol-3-phosphate dehydrogenase [Geomicrobium sediminis]|uniref:Glycerol-3-phosphate dehydrogenase [NAD(P)+] n=1 Tax=Geomicrobium sediminis TaxID=1347788 RepID=A0ABS2PDP3_9BACL|nr:NAD(P)H-dependent glycerol-3-phosphate dehydrogenase [Geomicrobium sediminis]MBM7633543.1 glycerol-3-phosphate dehydrogenase (NAD(P)+) [Geomicrobium sediminis]